MHKILYKLLNKSIERYYRTESAGRSFDYKLQTKLMDELSALNLPSDYCTEEWYKKQVLIFEELIFPSCLKTKEEIEIYLKSVMKKEKYTPPKINKLKTTQNHSVSAPSDIHADSLIHIEEAANKIPDDNNKESLKETAYTSYPLNEKQNLLLDNNTSEYKDTGKTDYSAEEYCIETENKEQSSYDIPLSELKQKNNLLYIPTVKETELSACAVSLKTKNTLILSKFESAILSGKRMVIEVVKSDNGTTYLLIWVPRIHIFFYSDLTEPVSNDILFPLFSKKQILKITYSPCWIYSLIYQYTKNRTHGIESIQFMHYLAEYTSLDYVSVFRSHGIIPTARTEYESVRPVTSVVFQMMPAYSSCYRKLKRHLYQKKLDKTYTLHKQLTEAISISYDMAFWLNKTSFLFTMPAPFSYKFNPVDLRRLQTSGYLLIYRAEYLNELPYPFFQEVLSLLVEKGRLWCIDIQIISYSENLLVLFLSESCFSYTLEIMSRTIFDCASGKEEYGILIDYKYVHITNWTVKSLHYLRSQ